VTGAAGSFSRVSVHVGADWTVRAITCPGQVPLLEIGAGQTEISFCLSSRDLRASTVEFATELARETERFAAEVQRMYAAAQLARHDSATPEPAD
jgi:hypothetical protein